MLPKAWQKIKLKLLSMKFLSRFFSTLLRGYGCCLLILLAGCNSVKIRAIKLQDRFGRPIENAQIEFKSRGSGHLLVDAIAGPTDKVGMAALSEAVYVNDYTYVIVKKDDWRHALDSDDFDFEKPYTLVVRLFKKSE